MFKTNHKLRSGPHAQLLASPLTSSSNQICFPAAWKRSVEHQWEKTENRQTFDLGCLQHNKWFQQTPAALVRDPGSGTASLLRGAYYYRERC